MELAIVIGLVGALIVASFLMKGGLERIGVPGMIGFLLAGAFVGLTDQAWSYLPPEADRLLEFMGQLGVIALLFDVGLKSDLKGLIAQLRSASGVWVLDVLFSGGLAFVTARFFIGLELVPALFVMVAFTATSVGVPLTVWSSTGRLASREGAVFLDVAELDDLSAIVLMALLFVAAPVLLGQTDADLVSTLGTASLGFILKFGLFIVGCYLFAAFVEEPLNRRLVEWEHGPDPMLSVAGFGLIIAATAESLGLSMAVGAFLAGLAFSRDPDVVKREASFEPVRELLVPFFFIQIGMMVSFEGFSEALPIAGLLLISAVVSKMAAGALGSRALFPWRTATIIGVSLIPRAEVAMIVMRAGRELGEDVVSTELFTGAVLVSATTCLVVPIVLRRLLDGQSS